MLHHGIGGYSGSVEARILLRLHPLPSHNYYAPPSSTVPRTTVRLLCASDAIKFETVLSEGGRTRDRAYWRGGSPSLCTRLRLRDPVLLLWFSSLAICPISFPLSCTLSRRLGPFAALRLDFVNSWATSVCTLGCRSRWCGFSLNFCQISFFASLFADIWRCLCLQLSRRKRSGWVFPFWGFPSIRRLSEIGRHQAHCRRKIEMFWNVGCKARFLED